MINFRSLSAAIVFAAILAGCATAPDQNKTYESEVASWTTHEDVAKWLRTRFVFDKSRQDQVQRQLKKTGFMNVLTRKPQSLYADNYGYCRDAAAFAKDALNRINPAYNARYIFIRNGQGSPNHWNTGFEIDGKIYVMDFGTGRHWSAMQGVHGPYESLDDYKAFLATLRMPGFTAEQVIWRDIPGKED